jgi:MoxR-like ATPase
LAKTLIVRTLAEILQLSFKRIQFTPDLMPADIIGSEVLQEQERRLEYEYKPGPVFANLILADEINRTPPKTQAALLEAMQEKTVTVAGKTYRLEEPFMVLATQNPIEQEGTYPLPEAQLDRFLFELLVDYPSLEEEKCVVAQHSYAPLDRIQPVLSREEVLLFRNSIAQVPAAPNVVDYAVRLVRATRPGNNGQAPGYIRQWIRWGASPRASQHLIVAGRARAACQGRYNVACDDVAALAPLVLRHRLIRTFQADAEGKSADDIITQLLKDVPREP